MIANTAAREIHLPSPLRAKETRRTWLLVILLAVITAAAYWPVARSDFINLDDPDYVTNNPRVLHGLAPESILWAFKTFHAGNWHPLTWLSHMLDCQLFGDRPAAHHLASLILHLANTALLFLVLLRLTKARWRSAFVAALFALHPLHVESVAWIAERKDVLSTFFFMLTLWAYVRHLEERPRVSPSDICGRPAAAQTRKSRIWYALALLSFALGLMSKPMLVTLPLVLLLLDYWPLQRCQPSPLNPQPPFLWPLLAEKAPFFALAVTSSVVTFIAQVQSGSVASIEAVPFASRLTSALVAYGAYLQKTFWPHDLAVFYPYPTTPPTLSAGVAAAVLAAISIAVVRCRRRAPYLLTGWCWFLATLLPVIGLIQVGSQSMADRYTYVPLLGLFLAIAWGAADLAARWPHRQTVLAATGGAVLGACWITCHLQVKYWQDSLTLFSHAVAVTGSNALAECNLGNALGASGHAPDAVAHLRQALRLRPAYAEAHVNLGMALVFEGKTDEAIQHYRAAINAQPNYAPAHHLLAAALALQLKNDEAKIEFHEALRLRPDYPAALTGLGNLLLQQGQTEEGLRLLFAAVKLRDDCEDGHYWLASALARQGRMPEAVTHFRAALRVQPDHPAALNDLAWILATERRPELRNVPEAIRLATRACELSAYTNPQCLDTLGTAFAQAGRWADAIALTEQAAARAAAAGQPKLAAQIRSHLPLYQTNSSPPFRPTKSHPNAIPMNF